MDEWRHTAWTRAKSCLHHLYSAPSAGAEWDIREVHHGRPLRGARSVFIAYSAATAPVVLKVYDGPKRARLQYEALREVACLTRCIVRPLHLLDGDEVLVTEWAGERNFEGELGGPDHLCRVGEVAAWMACFHEEVTVQTRTFSTEASLLYVQRMFGELRATGSMPGSAPARLEALADQARLLEGCKFPAALIHTDLKPANLVRGGSGIKAIDRPRPARGWPATDAAYFLVWLEALRLRSAQTGAPWPASAEQELSVVLNAYPKFMRTFLCYAVSRQVLVRWLQALKEGHDTPWIVYLDARCQALLGNL